MKNERSLECFRIEMDIVELEARTQTEGTAVLKHQLQLCQQDFRILAEGWEQGHTLAMQCNLYDVGDKVNKLLAWIEERDRDGFWVLEVTDRHGTLRKTSASIADAFADYYEDPHKSMTSRTAPDCTDLEGEIALLTICSEEREALEADLSAEELAVALRDLRRHPMAFR
ncbi:hypothetical protein NDU88_005662 [Pleurodeles waltl]|uniref:Uncharacterized protein n=1 Tax=Pleurodeles waltl TaxID=8319 RepID=A0AAV7QFE8_PLEWA|nr:hypothetical protein NDU88_005662 [Pleurodeles waltl]